MGQGEEGDVDGGDVGGVVEPEGAVPAGEVGVDVAEGPPRLAVGPEVDEVDVGMGVEEPHELTPGIAGGPEDGGAESHDVSLSEGERRSIRIYA